MIARGSAKSRQQQGYCIIWRHHLLLYHVAPSPGFRFILGTFTKCYPGGKEQYGLLACSLTWVCIACAACGNYSTSIRNGATEQQGRKVGLKLAGWVMSWWDECSPGPTPSPIEGLGVMLRSGLWTMWGFIVRCLPAGSGLMPVCLPSNVGCSA